MREARSILRLEIKAKHLVAHTRQLRHKQQSGLTIHCRLRPDPLRRYFVAGRIREFEVVIGESPHLEVNHHFPTPCMGVEHHDRLHRHILLDINIPRDCLHRIV